ncbi:hypothetical protein Tco_0542372 [Tanacetum coccineum]
MILENVNNNVGELVGRIAWNDDDDVLDVLGLDSRYKAKKGAGSRQDEPSNRTAGHQRASSRPAGLGRIAWNDDDNVLDVLGLDSSKEDNVQLIYGYG